MTRSEAWAKVWKRFDKWFMTTEADGSWSQQKEKLEKEIEKYFKLKRRYREDE